jgi:hypothetical protein
MTPFLYGLKKFPENVDKEEKQPFIAGGRL